MLISTIHYPLFKLAVSLTALIASQTNLDIYGQPCPHPELSLAAENMEDTRVQTAFNYVWGGQILGAKIPVNNREKWGH